MKRLSNIFSKAALICFIAVFVTACGGGTGSDIQNENNEGDNNSAPMAIAGADQNVATGTKIKLDASLSSDTDGDLITYQWQFTSLPDGSAAVLSDATSYGPTFTADLDGLYALSLIVNDGDVDSVADVVTITASSSNSTPMANAGADQNVATGTEVTLDGRLSSDADADPITYQWQFVSLPDGSAAVLSDIALVNPTFTADLDGAYVLSLTVNDGAKASSEDTVTITALTTKPVPVDNLAYHEINKWEYKIGPRHGALDTVLYYEVAKDYSIDLNAYFADKSKLPAFYGRWLGTDKQFTAIQNHIRVVFDQPIKWDFIELEKGILTLKKGYRWDGASRPANTFNIEDNRAFYVRCSAVHDAIYDLMRMNYLSNDHAGLGFNDPGFMNRLIADMMIYMIMVEDGRNKTFAQTDFDVIRFGGRGKTHKDTLLSVWKYHVSELTAWASDGKVDLHWQPADISKKHPGKYGSSGHDYYVYRKRNKSLWEQIGLVRYVDDGLYSDSKVFFTDTEITFGPIYYYQIKEVTGVFHDESNQTSVTPVIGAGNALSLEGYYQYVAADTLSGDISGAPDSALTLEAWVYPEYHPYLTAILALNASDGGNGHHVMYYDGANGTFCYHDRDNGMICSAGTFAFDKWYHVAVTINIKGEGILWVDGVQEASFSTTSRPKKTAFFSIGQERSAKEASRHFKGKIDEVRVWNTARTQAEIQANMCSPMRGDKAELIGLWHFDEPINSRKSYGATINGNIATVGGFDPNISPIVPSDAMSRSVQCVP
ncbi:MAG: PKD domain-containing protein [Deltaproteobacteria bacterium]|nr:PKD domain-containing protein [Deltaproteobacteria bacterium]